MKSRFGLDQFGQRTALGAMRFLLLALLALVLAYWTALESAVDLIELDWGRAARDDLVPEGVARGALRELERLKPILESRGVTCYTRFIGGASSQLPARYSSGANRSTTWPSGSAICA